MSSKFTSAGQSDVRHHLHPYTQLRDHERDGPLVIVRGEGVQVFDEHGKAYIEGMAGLWCASLGFSEQRLADAAFRQMSTLPYYHSFSGKVPGPVTELVEAMIKWAPVPMARVLFANSGSESNDTAFKLVRYYNNAKGRPLKKKIIARNKGYHGVTAAAASMSGLASMHQNFDLPLPGIVRVSCPHFYQFSLPGETEAQFVDRLAQELEDTILREGPDTVACVFVEPVQNAGGCFTAPDEYFTRVREICDRYGILMISDETICAWGRLGAMFACDRLGYVPDIITSAKGLTSGYSPLGTMIVSDRIAEPFAEEGVSFLHGFTFAGHPVSCAVAMANLDVIEREGIIDHVLANEAAFRATLEKLLDLPIVGDVRGMGFFYGIELVKNAKTRETFSAEESELLLRTHLSKRLLELGLVCRADDRGEPVIQVSPPLIAGQAEFDEIERIIRIALVEAIDILAAAGTPIALS